ncbi:potassium voltage-gated channel subfamily G member 3-like [Gadus morhua]|uniref:potassium voltage-gated channel subfamily G member 3-like n=1 Tax=Gadus morhua TaxID=8049 RepID=UPI0011B495B7|nr:potassium voltage-gated channel subfamily G member 3 [Gadus morhua]
MKFGKTVCVLNVGGARYVFSGDVIRDFPLSRVSRLHRCASEREVLEVCDDYDRETNEFFFDRHAEAFGFILLYVRRGALRFAPQMCELSFYHEMRYWGLETPDLEPCCQRRLDDRLTDTFTALPEEGDLRGPQGLPGGPSCSPATEPASRLARWLESTRRTFEEPTSSLAAQVLASVSMLFVLVSMVMLCASTLPDWRTEEGKVVGENRVMEAVCIGWFTAEVIIRFVVSQDKCEFARRPLNLIDLLSVTPYYVSVAVTSLTGADSQLQRAGVTLRVLRIMRVFWLIKLARHFLGLQTLGLTLRRCYREMVMLLIFVCVAMAIFSALAQLLEHGLDRGNPAFASIPAASWWVIISMTTVGYGDMYPVSVAGRVLGGLCVVSGIVLLALPITFIYHSFVQCYQELKVRHARCGRSLAHEGGA